MISRCSNKRTQRFKHNKKEHNSLSLIKTVYKMPKGSMVLPKQMWTSKEGPLACNASMALPKLMRISKEEPSMPLEQKVGEGDFENGEDRQRIIIPPPPSPPPRLHSSGQSEKANVQENQDLATKDGRVCVELRGEAKQRYVQGKQNEAPERGDELEVRDLLEASMMLPSGFESNSDSDIEDDGSGTNNPEFGYNADSSMASISRASSMESITLPGELDSDSKWGSSRQYLYRGCMRMPREVDNLEKKGSMNLPNKMDGKESLLGTQPRKWEHESDRELRVGLIETAGSKELSEVVCLGQSSDNTKDETKAETGNGENDLSTASDHPEDTTNVNDSAVVDDMFDYLCDMSPTRAAGPALFADLPAPKKPSEPSKDAKQSKKSKGPHFSFKIFMAMVEAALIVVERYFEVKLLHQYHTQAGRHHNRRLYLANCRRPPGGELQQMLPYSVFKLDMDFMPKSNSWLLLA